MTERFDRRAVLAGALTSLGIAAPTVLGVQVLDQLRSDGVSTAIGVTAVAAVAVALGLGGYVGAARSRTDQLLNGMAAALGAYAVIQVIAVVRLLTMGEHVHRVAIGFFALCAGAVGAAGATVAEVRTDRARRGTRVPEP